MALVAWKPLVARVYPTVRRGRFGNDDLTGRRVTGELTLSVGDRLIFRTGRTRSGGARLGATSSIRRMRWDSGLTAFDMDPGGGVGAGMIRVNCPLNFFVPAYYFRPGQIYAQLRHWPLDDGPTSMRGVGRTEDLWAVEVQAPKVSLVRVNWTDDKGKVSRPTDREMLGTLSIAQRMLPFPYFDTTILSSEIDSSAAFATAATNGGGNAAWTKLVTDLNVTRIFTALFGLGDIVYGMVPQAAIPPGAGFINTGCGAGAGGGFVNDGMTLAHEFGHLYGRPHVAVSGDPGNDMSYPNYDGKFVVHVPANHPRERVSLLALYTADDGASWQLIARDPIDGEVAVDSERLQGGEACRFRAIASAELRSATADTEPFMLARKPRRVHLDLPGEQCPVAPGAVAMAAHVDDHDRGADGIGGRLAQRAIIIVGGRR